MAISIKESFKVGFYDFWNRKLRSIVTIIGIMLGTMSIIVILSLVNGLKEQSIAWMNERGGIKKITVRRNWEFTRRHEVQDYFILKEFDFVRSQLPKDIYLNANIRDWGKMQYGKNTYWGSFIGALPDYQYIEEWFPDRGVFFSEFDSKNFSDVAVLGSTVKKELFGNKKAIGETITIKNRRLKVIGVMKERYFQFQGSVGNSENSLEHFNRRVYIPLETMIKKFAENDIRSFQIQTKTIDQVDEVSQKLEDLILNLRNGEEVFRVITAKDRMESMDENSKMFQIIFTFIGAISLLVGGVVIMNLMLASIQERTREIGIRLSVGARRIDIFIQFLVQTLIITFLGGLIGIIIGFSLLDIIKEWLETSMSINMNVVVTSLIITLFVGLFFGIYPAYRASNLDPVKALSYE